MEPTIWSFHHPDFRALSGRIHFLYAWNKPLKTGAILIRHALNL
jgi:hypothetical protein